MNQQLLTRLTALRDESEYIEFKQNNCDPESIGQYISALSNSAALHGASHGYLVWGIADKTHEVVGTEESPQSRRVGNEPIEAWLSRALVPRIDFRFHEATYDGKRLAWIEIPAATHTPVRFKDFEYIRVGQVTRKLRDHPEKERSLWLKFSTDGIEGEPIRIFDEAAIAIGAIDFDSYTRLTGNRFSSIDAMVKRLVEGGFLLSHSDGRCSVTTLGALVLARDLEEFPQLRRKAPRVIFYKGKNRISALFEQEWRRGYGVGFEGLIGFLDMRLPRSELVGSALRTESSLFPSIAVRELVANALIHQDLTLSGAGPMIEVFEDRVEISNPGVPLVDPIRIIDAPPRSRNERLATFMRRIGVCEERGSGVDKVISACELFQLPAPEFEVVDGFTRTTLYAPRPFKEMARADRIRACYQHAVLQWVSNQEMSNTSIRARFGITEGNAAQASRIIRDAVTEGVIKESDPENKSNKNRRYVPFWA